MGSPGKVLFDLGLVKHSGPTLGFMQVHETIEQNVLSDFRISEAFVFGLKENL